MLSNLELAGAEVAELHRSGTSGGFRPWDAESRSVRKLNGAKVWNHADGPAGLHHELLAPVVRGELRPVLVVEVGTPWQDATSSAYAFNAALVKSPLPLLIFRKLPGTSATPRLCIGAYFMKAQVN